MFKMNLDFLKIKKETDIEQKFKTIAEKLLNEFAIHEAKYRLTEIEFY